MYQIYCQGKLIGLSDKIRYVKERSIGCYTFCDEKRAQGILYKNKVYNISTSNPILGRETAVLVEVDSGAIIQENEEYAETEVTALKAENALLQQQVVALSDQNDFQEELIVELANIVYA